MKRNRAYVIAIVMVAILTAPASVAAAVPGNDLPAGATPLPSVLPQTIEQDTTDATVSTDDVGCGAGGLDLATVWYTFAPSTDVQLFVSTEAAAYDVGVNVFDSAADSDHVVTCFAGAGTADLSAGHTYYLMFADIDDDGTNGGQLAVSLEPAPPPIEVDITVDPRGSVSKVGDATISGTVTCSTEGLFAELDASLSQSVGRFRIHGTSSDGIECGVTPVPWKATISGDNGRFSGGRATVSISAFACDELSCGEASTAAKVRLSR